MDRNLEIGGGEMMMVTDTQKLVLPQSTESLVRPVAYGGGDGKSAHYKRVLGVRRSNFLLVLLVLMEMSFLCFGAFMFCSFEGPGEQELRRHLKMFRAAFLRNYSCLNGEPQFGWIRCSRAICIVTVTTGGLAARTFD
ncbi:hypothetical protein V5799_033723 [Amblyomma americanum]|uniref:Uncharacterized protein n=1 Tax=Amblyomma americanum TaxID=6943 RepID=A0AAQ4DMI1_AMBAM